MSAADIFGKAAASTNTRYRAVLQFSDLVVGGIPSDRSVIEKWIRSRMELGDQAIAELVADTAKERGVLTPDEAVALVVDSPMAPSVNGFKRDSAGQLCIEGRIVKAGIKEWANSAYPGRGWPGKDANPVTKQLHANRGLLKYLTEAVMVDEFLIGLGVSEPTRVEERIKHVMTPQGPRSSINRVEVVERPRVEFTVSVRDDFMLPEVWGRIWAVGEGIGLGSDRGRSDGKFSIEVWERLKK